MRRAFCLWVLTHLLLLLAAPFMSAAPLGSTGCAGGTIDAAALANSGKDVAGYRGEQIVHAATIINTGAALGVPVRGQLIAVAVAMGESSLRNLTYGDYETSGVIDPNTGQPTTSRGLFQQQHFWGSEEDRLNPPKAATLFYQAMLDVPGWDALPPADVAHEVQGNEDPRYYDPFIASAQTMLDTLATLRTGAVGQCSNVPRSSGNVAATGWAAPAQGPLTDGFGWRSNYNTGAPEFHTGQDFSDPCNAPIYAAQAGVVTFRGFESWGAGMIDIDHGGGVVTRYLHMEDAGMFVNVGDRVQAGQQIAEVGSTGYSTGCHLHFEVRINDEPVDPIAFMAEHGVTW